MKSYLHAIRYSYMKMYIQDVHIAPSLRISFEVTIKVCTYILRDQIFARPRGGPDTPLCIVPWDNQSCTTATES